MPRCGTYSSDLHENHPRIVRDLPISGKTCYLRFTRRRFLCPICQNPFSEPLSFVKEHRDYTNRYQVYFIRSERTILLLLCVLRNLHTIRLKASAKSYIPANPFVSSSVSRRNDSLKRLGIDEIALRKGKQDFVLILSNLDTSEIVDVIEKRTQEKLRQRLEQLTFQERNQITEVAIDMWEPYADVCNELLPNAVITVDRFHVAQAVNKELNKLKNKEKEQHPEALKGSHYTFLKNQDNLTDNQQENLVKIYETCPTLKMGHRLKECLRHIFESHSTKEKATQRIEKWLRIAESKSLFPDFRKTLLSWLDNITNYFRQRTTSGIVEGINNKVKLVKRRAFGFRNFEHFRACPREI